MRDIGREIGCSRTAVAHAIERLVNRLTRHFATRRMSFRSTVVPESMRQVWMGQLDTPPVGWKSG